LVWITFPQIGRRIRQDSAVIKTNSYFIVWIRVLGVWYFFFLAGWHRTFFYSDVLLLFVVLLLFI
jgi:hypothetical protein